MEALKEGFFIMVLGMGTVFMFLTIMIVAINICSKLMIIINKYFPEEEPESTKNKRNSGDNDAAVAAAVACAIHRMRRRGEK